MQYTVLQNINYQLHYSWFTTITDIGFFAGGSQTIIVFYAYLAVLVFLITTRQHREKEKGVWLLCELFLSFFVLLFCFVLFSSIFLVSVIINVYGISNVHLFNLINEFKWLPNEFLFRRRSLWLFFYEGHQRYGDVVLEQANIIWTATVISTV